MQIQGDHKNIPWFQMRMISNRNKYFKIASRNWIKLLFWKFISYDTLPTTIVEIFITVLKLYAFEIKECFVVTLYIYTLKICA